MANSDRSTIVAQVANGVTVRMAVAPLDNSKKSPATSDPRKILDCCGRYRAHNDPRSSARRSPAFPSAPSAPRRSQATVTSPAAPGAGRADLDPLAAALRDRHQQPSSPQLAGFTTRRSGRSLARFPAVNRERLADGVLRRADEAVLVVVRGQLHDQRHGAVSELLLERRELRGGGGEDERLMA